LPNAFSVEIHDYLTQKITEAEKKITSGGQQSPYFEGQLEELRWIRLYLKENVDLKNFLYY